MYNCLMKNKQDSVWYLSKLYFITKVGNDTFFEKHKISMM